MKIEDYAKMENDLREALKHSQQKYLVIGSLLMALNHKEYYSTVENIPKGRFCKNIYELAQVRFNLCKTSVKNLIGVRKRFGLFDDEIYPDYKKYTYTQLVEMLPLSDKQLELVNPEMSVQDIRALKKTFLEKDDSAPASYALAENLLTLNNDKERLEFLRNYKEWGVWKSFKPLNLEFYRCNLNNGGYIITAVTSIYDEEIKGFRHYMPITRVIDRNYSSSWRFFKLESQTITEILTYLRSTKAKPVILNLKGEK